MNEKNWIKVSEKLPGDRDPVFVAFYVPEIKKYACAIAEWHEKSWWFVDHVRQSFRKLDYAPKVWMPFPKLPSEILI